MKKLLILLLTIFTCCSSINTLTKNKQKIIILNGTSSSGKTSIIKQIQQIYPSPLLVLGIDLLWQIMPSPYTKTGPNAHEGFLCQETYNDENKPVITIKAGPIALRLNQQLPLLIKHLASTGFDIIADEVFLEKKTLQHYTQELNNYDVYFIGVFCDLVESEKREKPRLDREIGVARGQINIVHKYHEYYDFTVDTTDASSHDCAHQIFTYINNNQKPQGFKKLHKKLNS